MEIKEQFDHTFFYFMHLKTRYKYILYTHNDSLSFVLVLFRKHYSVHIIGLLFDIKKILFKKVVNFFVFNDTSDNEDIVQPEAFEVLRQ